MSAKSDWPEFEPEDARGYRTFSIYTGGGRATYRVSVHFGALRESLSGSAGDFSQYSETEQKSLKTAAAFLAAKTPIELATEVISEKGSNGLIDLSLQNLLESTAAHTPRAFELWFPGLAAMALQVASDACVKKTLNFVAEGFNAPLVTTEASVDIILEDIRKALKMFLNRAGRRLESTELIQDVREALRRVDVKPGKKPTQQQIAEILGVEPRALRARQAKYDIKSWGDMLRVCGWEEETNIPLN